MNSTRRCFIRNMCSCIGGFALCKTGILECQYKDFVDFRVDRLYRSPDNNRFWRKGVDEIITYRKWAEDLFRRSGSDFDNALESWLKMTTGKMDGGILYAYDTKSRTPSDDIYFDLDYIKEFYRRHRFETDEDVRKSFRHTLMIRSFDIEDHT